jgi:hypothetical protein
MNLVLAFVCAAAASVQDVEEVRERLKDPAQVFPVFQELLKAGQYAKAWEWTLSPKTRAQLPYEAFYTVMTADEMSYDVSKRLMSSLRVHKADAEAGTVTLCSAAFGFERSLRLTKFVKLYVLDLNRDELEKFVKYFAGRAMAWYRLQVKRADGWHYAYPPDWTYAPLGRSCVCGQ